MTTVRARPHEYDHSVTLAGVRECLNCGRREGVTNWCDDRTDPGELARLEKAEKEMIRAVSCLYIQVPSEVADDIKKKLDEYRLAMRSFVESAERR